jgi:MFS family permease
MTATGTEPLSPQAKNVLRVVFLTLFIDLIGFSIIFPLFPAMLKYYTLNDHSSYLLTFFTGLVDRFQHSAGGTGERVPIVLFGGLIGSIYAFLQFLFSPVWGSLSDKHGRKPVLTLCLAGIALSYVGWFFSKSFDLLVLSRVLSGAMAGNISVATAAVADVTNEKTRSKGMAIVGIAFGLGFIIGPAVGGLSSLWDLTHYFPALADLGVNPFSVPALIACVLALVNVSMMLRKLPETLPKDRREKQTSYRTINPLAILQTTQYPGVAASILTYFIYLTIFSGMEFTLTFLAADRLNYTPRANGMMFLFVGTILALVQGGYVRRKAHDIGEKRLALQGLVLIVPGLVVTGVATTSLILYVGLFFLACGSAMVIPALTSLTSLYAPQTVQGRVLGIFRSMGALSRAVGPLIACVLYWKLSGQSAYIVGGLFMVLPIALALRLPPVKSAGA